MAGSDDRIDIVVTDGIDPNVDAKLRSIADSADRGQTSVARLKAELASINTSSVTKLQTATETSTATLNKQLATQQTLTKSTEASSAVDSAAAANKSKLTAAVDAEAAAQARLAAVLDRTIARQEAANAAAASTTFAQGGNPFQAEANAASALAAQAATMKTAVTEAEAVSVPRLTNIKLAALGAFDSVRDALAYWGGSFKGFFGSGGAQTIEGEAGAVEKLGKSAAVNSVSIRELFVIGREASRGNFSRMAGSVTILAQALGLLRTVLIPLTLIIGAAAAGMKLFEESIRSDADPQLRAYADTLGLTHKEMRKLGDETVGAKGKLEEFNKVTLTFGDVWKGLGRTLEQDLDVHPDKLKASMLDAAIGIAKDFGVAGAQIYAAFYATFVAVKTLWDHGPAVFDAIGAQIANGISAIFEDMINDIIDGLNKIDAKARSIFHMAASQPMAHIALPQQHASGDEGALAEKTLTDAYQKGFANATNAEHKFYEDWKKNSIQAGKDRLKEMADALKDNRNPHKEADPKTKADYLADTNKKLDDELSRMHLLKDAREEQQRLDQIEEEFQKRRMPLNQAEIDGFKKKIDAIIEYKYQQVEMDKIYDEFNGSSKIYNASLAASADLLKRGAINASQYALAVAQAEQAMAKGMDPTGESAAKFDLATKLAQIQVAQQNFIATNGKFGISQQQAAEATNLANRAYQEATDHFFSLKQAMTQSQIASKLYGDAIEQNAFYQQIVNSEIGKRLNLSPQYVRGLSREVDKLMDQNKALEQQKRIQSTVGSIVNPMLQNNEMIANKKLYYAELNRLGDQYNLSEAQRAQARYALDIQFNQQRLQAMSDTFGQLAALSSSGNKKLALIGKAAAIAQATIDGIMAVQKALASAPPPWNVIEAGVIGLMTGANVAKIISTPVGNYKDGGDFMVQGNAGVDKNNISMNVSRGERVIVQTPEQQRASKDKGDTKPVLLQPKIVNILDPRMALDAMASREGDGVFMNFIERNAAQVSRLLG